MMASSQQTRPDARLPGTIRVICCAPIWPHVSHQEKEKQIPRACVREMARGVQAACSAFNAYSLSIQFTVTP